MADKKITALDDLGTALADVDLFHIVDDPSNTPINKKVTAKNVFNNIPSFIGLGQATIDAVNFATGQTISGAGGSSIVVEVHFNEQVTIAGGSPLMYVSNDQAGSGGASSITLTMDGGAGTRDTLSFSGTASNANVNANDVISIAAQTIDLNGATIVDAIGGGNAVRTISADVGAAAGTITVGS